MKITYIIVIALGFMIRVAAAHNLPLDIFFPGKSVVIAASFSLSPSEIESLYSNNGQYFDFSGWATKKSKLINKKVVNKSKVDDYEDCSHITNVRTCGQVDSFFRAAVAAMLTCNSYAMVQKASHAGGGLVPRFTAPETFVNAEEAADDHHLNYDISQGIAFDCVYQAGKKVRRAKIKRKIQEG